MGRSKRRKKKRRGGGQREQIGPDDMMRRVKETLPAGAKIVGPPSGQAKMSEVLGEFIEPYAEFAPTTDAYRKLVAIAAVAWNAALFPEERRQAMIEDVLEKGLRSGGYQGDLAEMKAIVRQMIDRKERYFSECKRMIISFEVVDTGDKYRLMVASTLNGPRA